MTTSLWRLWKSSPNGPALHGLIPAPLQRPHQSPAPSPSLTPPRSARALGFGDAAIPFSRLQCAVSVFAYVWLLSNFLRTGFAIRHLDGFHSLEPDMYGSFGPYAYTGNVFISEGSGAEGNAIVTSAKQVTLWGYKYDTTSIAMRAFAESLSVSAFPPCVFYKGKCEDNELLSPVTGFAMLDALVSAVKSASPENVSSATARARNYSATASPDPKYGSSRPQTLLLRVEHGYYDRIHHYLLPQVFVTPSWRTCQALYYSPALLAGVAMLSDQQNASIADFCSHAYGGSRPAFCDDLWANFDRSCQVADAKCRKVGRVARHAALRLSKLRSLYPNASVDLVIIEGSKDVAILRGGFTFVAKRGSDIITLFRIRRCSASSATGVSDDACSTQIIDEYRYEGESFTTDVLKWYPIVAALRGAAQAYFWLRLVMLYGGCYAAAAAAMHVDDNDSAEKALSASVRSTARRALTTFFKVPSQVVIYGSTFPLICYTLAHIIDSPMVYELTGQKFDSFNGFFHMSLWELVSFGSIQMRNVWVLAAVVHLVVRVATHRSAWSPVRGVWGMPQLSIALISSLTIFSQFRFISLRSTPVTHIQCVRVLSRMHPALESLGVGGKSTLAGMFLDLKAMACSTTILALLAFAVSLLIRIWRGYCKRSRAEKKELVFWRSHSATPLSAGVLWPTSALAVSWTDDLFQLQSDHFLRSSRSLLLPSQMPQSSPVPRRIPPSHVSATKVHPSPSSSRSTATRTFSTLDGRSESVEAVLFLMNLTMLSDPLAFLAWQWHSSRTFVGYFKSVKTQREYLLPLRHSAMATARCGRVSELDWSGFECERVVAANELTWSELLTCG